MANIRKYKDTEEARQAEEAAEREKRIGIIFGF